ncbi:MAG: restriction endonuclease subunit S [Candidatus Peregrinibacteria bacterium]|nr:restriction endonuclease subunit S [Candidatus Peregrinibacteria bacterium]
MPILELQKIAQVFNGKTPSKKEQRDKGFPVLKIKNVSEDGFFRGQFTSFVDEEMAGCFPQKVLNENDVLLLNAAHNSDYVGSKNCFVTTEMAGALATGEWMIIRADISSVLPRYLYFFINAPQTKQAVKNIVKGIHLYPKDLKKISIPIPSIEEQKRIVVVLSRADSLRRKRKEAIKLLDEYVESVFIEMFGDPLINPKNWQKMPLESLQVTDGIKCGPFGTQLSKSEFQDKGVPLWGIKHVNVHFKLPTNEFLSENKASQLDMYSLCPGDIVMTRKGTIGNCSVYPTHFAKGVMHSDLLRLRIDTTKSIPEYLSFQLRISPDVRFQLNRISVGAIMAGVNVTKLKKLTVLVPPLNLQRDFLEFTTQINEIRKKMRLQSDELNHQFNTIMQRTFANAL